MPTKKQKSRQPGYIHIFRRIAYVFPTIMTAIGAVFLLLYPLLGFRWQLVGIIVIIDLLILLGLVLSRIKQAKKTQIALIALSFIFGIAVGVADYLYYRAIHTMSTISTNQGDIVHSYLYVKADSTIEKLEDLQGQTIAVQPESSITMYEMLVDGIQEKGFDQQDFVFAPYTSYQTAYEEYLQDQVDAIILDDQAVMVLEEVYPEFATENKKIESYQRIIQTEESSNIDISKEPFTLLINGVDVRSGDLSQAANADVIMLATFNPQTMKLSLNSIPRDTYLPVTCRGFSDKITHSGSGGVQCTISSLEQAFDIDIDYYVKVNFFAVVDLVDALGGIEVDVPFSFTEQDEHDNQGAITLEAGLQTLNGSQALALARHRKTLPNGDIDRGLNQQLVIQAILQKVASTAGIWNVDKLLSVVGDNVQTNMPTSQMYGLFQMLTNLNSASRYGNLSALNIQMNTIEGEGAMFVPNYTNLEIWFYMPYQYSMDSTTRDIRRILGEEDYPLPTNTFAFNANIPYEELSEEAQAYMDNDEIPYDYSIPEAQESTLNRSTTMPDFTNETYSTIYNWCNAVDSELPDGYYMSCSFTSEDDSPIQNDAVFVSSSINAGSILSSSTLNVGSNPIQFVMRNPQTFEPEIEPEPETEPESNQPPIEETPTETETTETE